MAELRELRCIPCRGDSPTLNESEIASLSVQIPDWHVIDRENILRLERVYRFNNFVDALAFTNQVGQLAEFEGHHPALLTEWGKVTVTWWTHKIRGLHQNDFVMAAKTDQIFNQK